MRRWNGHALRNLPYREGASLYKCDHTNILTQLQPHLEKSTYVFEIASSCFPRPHRPRGLHFRNPVTLCQTYWYITSLYTYHLRRDAHYSPGPDAVDSVEHLKIVATVTNTGDETLKVLNDPRGPLNKSPTDTFVITDAKGSQPSFTGIKVKYVPKTAVTLEAYRILAPGESVVVEHDRKCHLPWFVAHHIIYFLCT